MSSEEMALVVFAFISICAVSPGRYPAFAAFKSMQALEKHMKLRLKIMKAVSKIKYLISIKEKN
jgi:hypothetical protein